MHNSKREYDKLLFHCKMLFTYFELMTHKYITFIEKLCIFLYTKACYNINRILLTARCNRDYGIINISFYIIM